MKQRRHRQRPAPPLMQDKNLSEFFAVSEVAGVAQTRHNVFVLINFGVNHTHPHGGDVLWQDAGEIVDGLLRGDNRCNMDFCRHTAGKQSLEAEFHRRAGGKHGVAENQCLALDGRRGEVFDAHVEMIVVLIFTVGRDKGIFGIVEISQETLMERHSGTEYGGEDNLLVYHLTFCRREGSGDFYLLVTEGLAHLVCHDFAYALEISAEAQAVVVGFGRAHFCKILAYERGACGEFYNILMIAFSVSAF